jgi:hypothetical protein
MQEPPEPPPQYAAYPRPYATSAMYGSADKVRALYKGYQGLSAVFVLNILLAFILGFTVSAIRTPEGAALVYIGGFGVLFVIIALTTYSPNKQIAYGANWASGMALLASLLIALNSVVCCGIIGYVVVQQLAANEMKKYGLKSHLFGGIRKREVEQVAQQLETLQRSHQSSATTGY